MTEVVHSFGQAGASIHRRCSKLAKELPIVEKAGQVAVGEAIVGAVSANMGGKSIVLSGVGKHGAKVAVKAVHIGAETIVRMTGPAHFVERDTNPHPVGTGAVSEAQGHRMHMPDGRWATGPFIAGGSQGKHVFARGVDEVRPVAPKIYEKGVRVAALRAGFG